MSLIRVFLILSTYSITYAATEQVCFSNQKEYTAVQAKLPPVLQKTPIQFAIDNFLITAVASLKPGSNSIVFFFNASKGIDKPIEEKVTVCATQDDVELRFDNGTKELIEIRNESEIFARRMLIMQHAPTSRFTNISNKILSPNENTSKTTIESNTTGSRGNL